MLHKTTKLLGQGAAFIASCAAFTASLAAYPFIAVLLLGSSLFKIWGDFFMLRNEEQRRTNIANIASRAMYKEGGAGAADFLFERKNSTLYDSVLVGKAFLRQVGMSFLSPFISIFGAIPLTLLFAKRNAEIVYSKLSTTTELDEGKSWKSIPISRATISRIDTSNTIYQEPKSRQQTFLHTTKRAASAPQANDAQSNDNTERRRSSFTIK